MILDTKELIIQYAFFFNYLFFLLFSWEKLEVDPSFENGVI